MRFNFRRFRRRKSTCSPEEAAEIREKLDNRSIVLVGLMGAGKTAIGRRLATSLGLEFTDADTEIEYAAGKSVSDIFEEHGEEYFRDGERKVISRLLSDGPQVLATGGGAYMNQETRSNIKETGISIWLNASLPVLLKRVQKRDHRPLLKTDDIETVMKKLINERYPVYEQADIAIKSRDVPHEIIVGEIVNALEKKLRVNKKH